MATEFNPEALHDIAASTTRVVSDNFVNPGTPSAPLVTAEQRRTGKIEGKATETLRSNLIK